MSEGEDSDLDYGFEVVASLHENIKGENVRLILKIDELETSNRALMAARDENSRLIAERRDRIWELEAQATDREKTLAVVRENFTNAARARDHAEAKLSRYEAELLLLHNQLRTGAIHRQIEALAISLGDALSRVGDAMRIIDNLTPEIPPPPMMARDLLSTESPPDGIDQG